MPGEFLFNELLLVAGGLGVFLFGMSALTDGLRGLAGNLLQRTLARFTRSPASGALSGALLTALLQSSSAVTVAAVGFVSAGLLSFAQALGVVFGANFGTTVTGWLVALLGLKFSIGSLAYPLVLGGALMRLFGRARLASGGTALAGFGLIFVGIGLLQDGMAAYHGVVTPEVFPDDSWLGRLQLLGIGVAITLVTQSSSAGVAAALTAVYTGTISFPQAAALVIGMDIGTTVTAALATLGGSEETRRTGYSHVIYNLLTALGALLLLTPYTWALGELAPGWLAGNAELALVGFHSLFNLLGVLLVLPFAAAFSRLMFYLVPALVHRGREPDRMLLREPVVALDAACNAAAELVNDTLRLMSALLQGGVADESRRITELANQVDRLQAYIDGIHLMPEQEAHWRRLNALIHLIDHLERLLDRCEDETERVKTLAQLGHLRAAAEGMRDMLEKVLAHLAEAQRPAAAELAGQEVAKLAPQVEQLRSAIMAEMAAGKVDIPQGTAQLEAVRWMSRGSTHVARILLHLARLRG